MDWSQDCRGPIDGYNHPTFGGATMTAGGTKYWKSGTIPLIAPEILGNIISEVSDLGVVVDESGIVLSVLINPKYDSFRGLMSLEGKQFRDAMTVESLKKFNERFAAFLAGSPDVLPVELNHKDEERRWEYPVRYSFHRIGPDGTVLMLGRDLRPVAEMQQQLVNAQLALERDYEAQRKFETRFRVLMENVTDAVVFVSMQTGKITQSNTVANLLIDNVADGLNGQVFANQFEGAKPDELVSQLSEQALSDHTIPIDQRLRGHDTTVSLYPTLFRAAGERVLMCRIAPKDAKAGTVDTLTENMRSLYLKGSDAIVFTDRDGAVLSSNEGFLNLIGVAHDVNVRGRGIADFMQRGSVDFKVMTENASRSGKMRMYATKVAGEYGSPRSVEVAVTTINAGAETVFAFVIRESSRAEPTRNASEKDESMQSVVELVGSATLKDIVAETTNVVEKMCIETAVELTSNNRVAAAEMLGLSRQSLYVKLRKFGIMDREKDD